MLQNRDSRGWQPMIDVHPSSLDGTKNQHCMCHCGVDRVGKIPLWIHSWLPWTAKAATQSSALCGQGSQGSRATKTKWIVSNSVLASGRFHVLTSESHGPKCSTRVTSGPHGQQGTNNDGTSAAGAVGWVQLGTKPTRTQHHRLSQHLSLIHI